MIPATTTRGTRPSEAIPTKWLAVKGLIFLTAALSSGAYESDEGLLPGSGDICAEDSTACVAPGGSPGVSSVKNEMPTARTKGKWVGGGRGKRRRRVGFSHEDVASDASLRPFLQTFRDSLSGLNKKDVVDTAAREQVSAPSAVDTWTPAAQERNEVFFQEQCGNW